MAALSLAAALGATWWILHRSGADPGQALRYLPPASHLAALGALAVHLVARGARVWFVARGLGLPLRLWTSIQAQVAADGLAAVTPSRVGSDPAKIAVLRRDGLGIGPCGALLVAEMAAEATVLLVCAGVVLLTPWGTLWIAAGLAGYAVLVSALGVAAFFVSKAPGHDPPGLWMRVGLGAGRWAALLDATREFREHTVRLRRLGAASVLAVLGATVVHIAARVSVLPLLVLPLADLGAAALPGGTVPELVVRPFFVLYATALLPPPGGGGGVEMVFAAVLGGLLAPAVLAATLVWWRVYTFYLSAALGGLALFLPGIVRAWTDDRPADPEDGPPPDRRPPDTGS